MENLGLNLDGETVEDLKEYAEAFELLAEYARYKARAMELRAAGDIPTAAHYERKADARYSELPAWAQW